MVMGQACQETYDVFQGGFGDVLFPVVAICSPEGGFH